MADVKTDGDKEDVKKKVQDDINEMLDSLEGKKVEKAVEADGEAELAKIAAERIAAKAATAADEKKDEQPPEKKEDKPPEVKKEEEKKDETKDKTEIPSTESEDKMAEKKDGVEDKMDGGKEGDEGDKEDDPAAMRKAMNEMAAQLLAQKSGTTEKVVVEEKPAEKAVEKKEEKKEEVKLAPVTTLQVTDAEYEEAMSSPEKFNKLVMEKAAAYTEGRLQEVIRSLGNTIPTMVQEMVDIRNAATDFYAVNKDLIGFKSFVGMVANEMFSKNPDKPLDEVFNIVGKEVRKRLKLKKEADDVSVGVERKSSPAVVDKSRHSTRKPEAPKLTGMEADIEAMLEHDRRY